MRTVGDKLSTWHRLYTELQAAREASKSGCANADRFQQDIGRLMQASEREFEIVRAALDRRPPPREGGDVNAGGRRDAKPSAQRKLF